MHKMEALRTRPILGTRKRATTYKTNPSYSLLLDEAGRRMDMAASSLVMLMGDIAAFSISMEEKGELA